MAYTVDRSNTVISPRRYSRIGFWSINNSVKTVLPGTRSGTKVPQYRKIIANGGNATSYFHNDIHGFVGRNSSIVRTTWKDPSVIPHRTYVDECAGEFYHHQPITHLIGLTAELDASVISKLHSKLREQRSHVNSMNAIGELRETIRMIRRPFESLQKYVQKQIAIEQKTLNRIGKIRHAGARRRATAELVAGTNLEIAFGWRPFISDIKEHAVALAKFHLNTRRNERISAFGSDSRISVNVNSTPSTFPPTYVSMTNVTKFETKVDVRYVVGLRADIVHEAAAQNSFLDRFGFTAENIVPTIYEQTPWSWAIDYFSNLGDLIEAYSTSQADVLWVSKTVRQRTTQQTVVRAAIPSIPPPYVFLNTTCIEPDQGTSFRSTVTRSPMASLPMPNLVFTHPGQSVGRLANLLSVMASHSSSVNRSFRF